MKTATCTIAAVALMLLSAHAAHDEAFNAAQAAYGTGRYDEAARLYDRLLDNGVANVEVHYNLANACFKSGDLPKAILHYRKAWYLSPRDPDIRANLRFALKAAGAVEPATTMTQRIFDTCSANEWIAVAIGGYVAFCLLLILGLLYPSAKRTLFRLSLVPAMAILASAGGWSQWHRLQNHPEWVVTKPGATALFGPVEGGTAHYKVPLAALVRQQASDPKGWIEIEYDGKKGWLKSTYIKRVSP